MAHLTRVTPFTVLVVLVAFVVSNAAVAAAQGGAASAAETRARALDVHGLWAPGVGDGGHDLRGHAYPADALVPGDLVGGQPEERRQRLGLAARPRFGQLPHGLDVAAQAPPRDGAAGIGSRWRSRWTKLSSAGSSRAGDVATSARKPWWSLLPRCVAAASAESGCSGWPMRRQKACWPSCRGPSSRAGHRCDHRRAAELPRPVEARLSPRLPRCAGQWRVDGRGVASHSPGCCAPQALAPGYTSGRGQP